LLFTVGFLSTLAVNAASYVVVSGHPLAAAGARTSLEAPEEAEVPACTRRILGGGGSSRVTGSW
jgi:hypothetical protein